MHCDRFEGHQRAAVEHQFGAALQLPNQHQPLAGRIHRHGQGLGIGAVEARQRHRHLALQIHQHHLLAAATAPDQGQPAIAQRRGMAASDRLQPPVQAAHRRRQRARAAAEQ